MFKTLALLAAAVLAGCAASATPPPAPVPVAAPSLATSGSIYGNGARLALFADRRPRAVGDTLTVVLVEQTSASKSAKTSSSKSDSIEIAGPTVLGRGITVGGNPIFDTSINTDRSFDGTGDSSQSNKLSGSVTVRVVAILPSGNLAIEGEKQLTLNQGDETIRIKGEVSPADIASDNTVLSSRVADARIEYAGTGSLADSNRQGWLTRVLNSWLWPF